MPYSEPRKEATGRSFAEQKQEIYERIQALVWKRGGGRINLEEAREVFDLVMEEAILAASKDGVCRLNRGLGSLKVRHFPKGTRRLPTSEVVDYPARRKIQLDAGQTTLAILAARANAGDSAIRRRLGRAVRDSARRAKNGKGN